MKHSWLSRRLAVAAIAALLVGLIPTAVAVAGTADHFVITGHTVVTQGASNTYTVAALDSSDAVDTNYTGEVTLSSDLGLSDPQEFSSGDLGVHAYSGVTLNSTGNHTLTASDGNITDGTLGVNVRAEGAATHLVVSAPGTATVGVGFTVNVTAKDDGGTTDTGYTGTVHFTTDGGSPTLPANYPFTGPDNGTHAFTGVAFGAAGTWTVTATDTGTPAITGTSGPVDTRRAQTITFAALPAIRSDQLPFTVSATATSGLDVTFSSNTTGVCDTSGTNGTTVDFVGSGLCTIQADQAGDATWEAAPPVIHSFMINTATAQAITFDALVDKRSTQMPITVAASSDSGLTVTFTSDTPGVCTSTGANGVTVNYVSAGLCTIRAHQAGNSTFDPAPEVTQSFHITVASSQTITFPAPPANVRSDTMPITVGATSSSGLPVSLDSTTPSVCTASGTTSVQVNYIASGTCTIQATQAGDATHEPATPISHSFVIHTATPQTITFDPLADKQSNQMPFGITATSTSGLTVTFTTTTSLVCDVVGTSVSYVGPGLCTIDANQAGDTTYDAAPTVSQSFNIKTSQTITFGALSGLRLDQTPLTVSGTATSTLAVTFTSATPLVCTSTGTNGTTITLLAAGTCTIHADQAGDTNWAMAPQVSRSFTVNKGNQTITFGVLVDKRMDESGFTVSATASSGLPVTFSSATPLVCTQSGANGATILLVAIGTCIINADQAGNSDWNVATTVPQPFTVSKGTATLAFTSVIPPAYVAGPTYTPTASSLSPVAIVFTIDAGSSAVCTISGGAVSFINMGNCVINANQAGNANWNAASQVQQTVPVSSGIAVSFSLVVPTSAVLGVPQTVSVTARDSIGLIAAAYVGTVHLSSTDVTAGLPANYTFVSGEHGTHIFSSAVTFNSMGTGLQTITAADVSSPSIAGTSAQIAVGPASCTYYPLSPVRLLDTRLGIGLGGSFNSHVARSFQVTGHGNVPAGATAVTGNLTVTAQTRGGYLFAGPLPMDNPTSSTLNFPTGDDRANAVTVALGNTGTLSITYVGSGPGTAQVIFDVTGYFKPDLGGATYHPLAPARILDTRDGTGGSTSPLVSHVFRTFQVTGHGNVPGTATAVTGNLTVTGQGLGGYFFIGPVGMNDPTSSTLNFPTGDDRANAVTVKLGDGIKGTVGTLSVTYVGSGPSTAHAIFDVTGYFTQDTTGSKYVALNPSRVLDTRDGTGGSTALLGNHVARPFQVTGHGGVPVTANAVTGNLTVTSQSRNGYLFIGPVPMNDPTSSTLNFPFGDDRANAVTVALGTGPSVGMLNVTFVGSGPGQTHSIFDVTGYFVAAP